MDPENPLTQPLSCVLLAGGGSRMGFAKRVVQAVTGMEAVSTAEPETLVSVGASCYSKYV